MASPPMTEPHQPSDFKFPKREFGKKAKKLVVKIGFQPVGSNGGSGFTIARIRMLFFASFV